MLTVVFVLKCHFAISSPISKPGHLRWTITTMSVHLKIVTSHLVDWLHSSRLNNKFLSYVHLHLLHQTQGQKKSHFVAVCCYVESNSCSSFFPSCLSRRSFCVFRLRDLAQQGGNTGAAAQRHGRTLCGATQRQPGRDSAVRSAR